MRTKMIPALLGCLLSLAAYAEEPTTDTPALWGSPTVDNGACCKTLGEVRGNIDRLDRDIVRLIAEFHGGEALAQNLPDGSGVRFQVRLAR